MKILIFNSRMFPQQNIHKYTWTSPEGKTHNQIDHILIDRRWYSSILEVRSFKGADSDSDQYMVVAKVRGSLAVNKQGTQRFHGERFNLRKLNELEVRKEYQIEITNRFVALENSCGFEDINRNWDNINRTIQTAKKILGLQELKQHKPWFDD